MAEVAWLYAQIALLRKGPQDLPASALLLTLTVIAYLAINAVMSVVLPGQDLPWPAILITSTVFTLVWYAVLLRLARRPERTLQTTTAIFGYRTVLAPLTLANVWVFKRFSADPAMWPVPVIVLYLLIGVWIISVNSHVLKAAVEWATGYCVALVLLETFVTLLVLTPFAPQSP